MSLEVKICGVEPASASLREFKDLNEMRIWFYQYFVYSTISFIHVRRQDDRAKALESNFRCWSEDMWHKNICTIRFVCSIEPDQLQAEKRIRKAQSKNVCKLASV